MPIRTLTDKVPSKMVQSYVLRRLANRWKWIEIAVLWPACIRLMYVNKKLIKMERMGKEGTLLLSLETDSWLTVSHYVEWQNWASEKLFVNVDPKAFLQKQARLICEFPRPFFGIFILSITLLLSSHWSNRSCWDPSLPHPVIGTLATASFPCTAAAQIIAVTFHFSLLWKKHSGRKLILLESAPGPLLQGECGSQFSGWLFPCMVEAAFHGLITQRKINLSRHIELSLLSHLLGGG